MQANAPGLLGRLVRETLSTPTTPEARAPPPATRPPLLGVAGSPSTFNDVLRRDPPLTELRMLSPARPLTGASSDPLAQIRDVLRRDPLFPIRALHSWVMANQRQHLTLAEATAAAQGRVRAGDLNGAVLLLRQTARDGLAPAPTPAAQPVEAPRVALHFYRPHGSTKWLPDPRGDDAPRPSPAASGADATAPTQTPRAAPPVEEQWRDWSG